MRTKKIFLIGMILLLGQAAFAQDWQGYVDQYLVGNRGVVKGAIVGHDGSVWARSPANMKIDAKPLIEGIKHKNTGKRYEFDGITYMMVRCDKTTAIFKGQGRPGKPKGGWLVVSKTGQTFVIGVHVGGQQAGNTVSVVGSLAKHLIGKNY